MNEIEEHIPVKESLRQIRLALRRAALIYHYFSDTLIKEFGEERGRELIRKAVDAYGERIGEEARQKALKRGKKLGLDNFESDLPDIAWETELVVVDGEERARVHHCPLASEWLKWSDHKTARLYCFVDQAKIKAFNPDFEYIHIKNLLDGDSFCELAVRPVKKDTAEEEDPSGIEPEETVKWLYGRYSREDLDEMDPVCLRALFRERVHHTIEVDLYPILLGEKKASPNFGKQPELILDVWKERGFPEDDPDIDWGKTYISLAQKIRKGESVTLSEPLPAVFNEQELKTVNKLIWGRHSIRDWVKNKDIPDKLLEQILEAGRAAPTACNLDIVRFIVIRDPEEIKMVWSDIPTPADRCILIVICYDEKIYQTVGHDHLVPHNQLYDCAAAADHMCLMAHALGLGAVWLTRTAKTASTFKRKYGLPDHIEPAMHIALGWPAAGTIKSRRMPLKEMIITRKT
jgi:nitroreductase